MKKLLFASHELVEPLHYSKYIIDRLKNLKKKE